MSSQYGLLCVSHDPALTVETDDWNRPGPAEEMLLSGHPGHPHCKLVAGRYSYPLIEAGFKVGAMTEWVDVVWLRVLYRALESGEQGTPLHANALAVLKRIGLTRDEFLRLGPELGSTWGVPL